MARHSTNASFEELKNDLLSSATMATTFFTMSLKGLSTMQYCIEYLNTQSAFTEQNSKKIQYVIDNIKKFENIFKESKFSFQQRKSRILRNHGTFITANKEKYSNIFDFLYEPQLTFSQTSCVELNHFEEELNQINKPEEPPAKKAKKNYSPETSHTSKQPSPKKPHKTPMTGPIIIDLTIDDEYTDTSPTLTEDNSKKEWEENIFKKVKNYETLREQEQLILH